MESIARRGWINRLLQAPRNVIEAAGGFGAYVSLVFRSRLFFTGIGLFALFGIAAFFTPFDPLYLIITFCLISVEFLLIMLYGPAVMLALIASPPKERDYLIIGIWLSWTVDFLTRIVAVTMRYTPESGWLQQNDLLSFLLFVRLNSAVMHITAPMAIDGRTKNSTWIQIGFAFFAGVIVATIIFSLVGVKHLIL